MYAAGSVAVPSPSRPPEEREEPENGALREVANGAPANGAALPDGTPAVSSSPPPGQEPADPTVPVIPDSPEGTVLWRVRGMIRSMRPHQWVKNTFVLAPIVFAKELTDPRLILKSLGAFGVFCMLAGAIYTMNDLVDAPADRVHPVKRHRPIASGRVPVPVAKAMVVVLVIGALGAAALGPWRFFLAALVYFLKDVAYSFRLKRVAYVDVGFVALGFVLRVLAGGYATHTEVSGYMIACTAMISLFQGFGKRRHELGSANAAKQRAALQAYSPRVLNVALGVTGFGSVALYLAYALEPKTEAFFATSWLWVTTIHPLFGVIRFLQLVVGRPKAESPTQEMLRDVPFVLNLVLWAIEVVALVYHVKLQ
jgi:4-hydroxybenzoate polyprenyltransferase